MATTALSSISAPEARRRLSASVQVLPAETVPLSEAGGRVLATEVRATVSVPAFPRSAMDGFAVRSADVGGAAGAEVTLRVVGRVAMGEPPLLSVGPSEAVAVSTGAHLPPGADAVVMVEDTAAAGEGYVAIRRAVDPGRHVVAIGEEFQAGGLVLAPGARIRGQQIAALAAFGITRPAVFRRARVAVLSTGSELCAPEQEPTPGKVRDLNQHALACAVEATGAVVTRAGIVAEDEEALAQTLSGLLAGHDLLVLTGGSSVGARDFTPEAVRRLGAELLFHGIDVRPGRPTLAARLDGRILFGLPGVPAAAMTIFQVFVEPVLRSLQGEAASTGRPAHRTARLAEPHASRRGREDYLRVRLSSEQGDTWASVLPGPTSLASLVRSEGLVIVPVEVEALARGETVEVLLG